MHQQRKWEVYHPLMEFSYNNEYQESLRMSPFEALYGQICNTPISWSDLVNRVLIGLDMLAEMEQEMLSKGIWRKQRERRRFIQINIEHSMRS